MAKNDGPSKTFGTSDNASDRSRALGMAMSQIEKQFGKGSIMMHRSSQAAGHRAQIIRLWPW